MRALSVCGHLMVLSMLSGVQLPGATGAAPVPPIPAFFYRSSEGKLFGKAAGFNVTFDSAAINVSGKLSRIQIQFVGANAKSVPKGLEPTGGVVNVISGADPAAWRTGQDVFRTVLYRSIYPGIDAEFGADRRLLKSQYYVAPGANPSDIRIRYEGARNVSVADDGSLLVETIDGALTEAAPVAYQQTPTRRNPVAVAYTVDSQGYVGFKLGAYDPKAELVIDPTLAFSTYIGGNGVDVITSMAVDTTGNVYLAGYTDSIDFPVQGALQPRGGSVDAFAVKISASGDRFLYATYIGGSGYDQAFGIAVDANGRAVLTGSTTSANFPVLNASQSSLLGGKDAWLLMLSSTGSTLVFSTLFGGSGADSANAIALGPTGAIYIAGDTTSTDLRVLSAYQPVSKGRQDAFAAKFSAAGALVYSTYVGGMGDDKANSIAVDSTGAAYLAGETSSPDFPASTGFQKTNGGGQDAFIAKLSATGSTLLYGSYLGGTGGLAGQPEAAYGVTVDSTGNVYVCGVTSSANFPVASAYQSAFAGGGTDAFVAKVNPSGSALVFSTYLGGIGDDSARSIAIEPSGTIAVTGTTFSVNLPGVNALQSAHSSQKDAFVTRFSAAGTTVLLSTYLGGNGQDAANAIAWSPAGDLWVAGQTTSSNFPMAVPLQSFGTVEGNGFVAKITFPQPPGTPSNPSPATGITGAAWNVQLGWTAATGATSYDVYFGTSATPPYVVNTASTSYNPGALSPGTVYYWKVVAKNMTGNTSSAVWSFSTYACTYSVSPPAINLAAPAANGTFTVTAAAGCAWSASSNAGWLTITSGSSGATSGTVAYAASANVSAAARSATVTIAGQTSTVTQAGLALPTVVGVSPPGGTGYTQVFTYTFSHASGWQNLSVVNVLIRDGLDAAQACYIGYVVQSNLMVLVGDSGNTAGPFAGAIQVGSGGTMSNSQCTISGTSAVGSGTTLTLTMTVTFTNAFAGNKIFFLAAGDVGGSNTGWQTVATWCVPGRYIYGPTVGGVSPVRSTSTTQTFTFTFLDNYGWQDISVANVLMNGGLDARQACYIALVPTGPTSGYVYLVNDAGATGGPFSTLALPGSGTAQNSQCTLSSAGSYISGSGNTLTLTLTVTFNHSFAGNKMMLLSARSNTISSYWEPVATFYAP